MYAQGLPQAGWSPTGKEGGGQIWVKKDRCKKIYDFRMNGPNRKNADVACLTSERPGHPCFGTQELDLWDVRDG